MDPESGAQTTVSSGGSFSDPFGIAVIPTPPNSAPEAQGDAYATEEDTTLTVPASEGMLANDSDPDEGDTLTAELVDDVDSGTLTLNPDGSFTYTPDPRFDGQDFEDSFTYRASDGEARSDEAIVTISVGSACTKTGTEGRDLLVGTSGEDVICGLGGDDIIVGLSGGDTLQGGGGDDVLLVQDRVSANDSVDGEEGNDFCLADQGDTLTNCERGSVSSLSVQEKQRLNALKATTKR